MRWNSVTLSRRLNMFARDGFRKGSVQAKHTHPHMMRKTFAQLAVRRDKSRLGPVAAQLGHAYSSFTDQRYVGASHPLASLIAEEDRKELARSLEHLLTCDRVGGKAASAFQRVREQVGQFRGRKSMSTLIDQLIGKGVLLAPCDWGFCVYTRSTRCVGEMRRGLTRSTNPQMFARAARTSS